MPLLDSFKVNHTIMQAPAVRLAKSMVTPLGDHISVYDLRFCKPNVQMLPPKGMHTFEHLFAGFMRDHLNSDAIEIIDISPMGCRTGFYMSLIGEPSELQIVDAWYDSCKDIIKSINDKISIPEANIYQCGSCEYHSVEEAKKIAEDIVNAKIKINKNEDILLNEAELSKLIDRKSVV